MDLISRAREARRFPSPAMARAIRISAGISQEDIAAELGVHRLTVTRWESGAHSPRGGMRTRYGRLLRALEEEVTAT